MIELLFQLMEQGHLKMNIYKSYPLDQAKQAHDDLESRKSSGKLLLSME